MADFGSSGEDTFVAPTEEEIAEAAREENRARRAVEARRLNLQRRRNLASMRMAQLGLGTTDPNASIVEAIVDRPFFYIADESDFGETERKLLNTPANEFADPGAVVGLRQTSAHEILILLRCHQASDDEIASDPELRKALEGLGGKENLERRLKEYEKYLPREMNQLVSSAKQYTKRLAQAPALNAAAGALPFIGGRFAKEGSGESYLDNLSDEGRRIKLEKRLDEAKRNATANAGRDQVQFLERQGLRSKKHKIEIRREEAHKIHRKLAKSSWFTKAPELKLTGESQQGFGKRHLANLSDINPAGMDGNLLAAREYERDAEKAAALLKKMQAAPATEQSAKDIQELQGHLSTLAKEGQQARLKAMQGRSPAEVLEAERQIDLLEASRRSAASAERYKHMKAEQRVLGLSAATDVALRTPMHLFNGARYVAAAAFENIKIIGDAAQMALHAGGERSTARASAEAPTKPKVDKKKPVAATPAAPSV